MGHRFGCWRVLQCQGAFLGNKGGFLKDVMLLFLGAKGCFWGTEGCFLDPKSVFSQLGRCLPPSRRSG